MSLKPPGFKNNCKSPSCYSPSQFEIRNKELKALVVEDRTFLMIEEMTRLDLLMGGVGESRGGGIFAFLGACVRKK